MFFSALQNHHHSLLAVELLKLTAEQCEFDAVCVLSRLLCWVFKNNFFCLFFWLLQAALYLFMNL